MHVAGMCGSGADQRRKACVSLGLAIAVRRSTRHQWGLPGDVRKRARRVRDGCSLRSQCPKSAKVLARERIRDAVRHTFDIRGRYVEILQSTHQEQTAQQGHDVWAAARPLVERRDNCLVVWVELYPERGPLVTPCWARQCDRVEFFVGDTASLLVREPGAREPTTVKKGAVTKRSGGIGKEVHVRGWRPARLERMVSQTQTYLHNLWKNECC